MASYTITVPSQVPYAISKTLTTTTADTVTITSPCAYEVCVINRAASNTIYVRADGVTAVAAADAAIPVLPSVTSEPLEWCVGAGVSAISIVGSGDAYSVRVTPINAG